MTNKPSPPSVLSTREWENMPHLHPLLALNVLSALISWSYAPWELSAANWFFSVYQKRSCCMHALITASLYTGSLRCTFVALQSAVCQQGWPWGSRNAMNNWINGHVYIGVLQLPVHCQHCRAFDWNKIVSITISLNEIPIFFWFINPQSSPEISISSNLYVGTFYYNNLKLPI